MAAGPLAALVGWGDRRWSLTFWGPVGFSLPLFLVDGQSRGSLVPCRLVEINQQGVNRQAPHPLVVALHRLLIPLPGLMAEVLRRGVAVTDLLKGVGG